MIDQFERSEAFRKSLEPIVLLPEMRRPCVPVEKGHADYMRDLLLRTCAALRLEKP